MPAGVMPAMGMLSDPFLAMQMPGQSAPAGMRSNNPPNTTLFVANLESRMFDQEVRQSFESRPGFVHIKLTEMRGSPVAFVEYSDIQNATQAMESLQGHRPAGATTGIRIEFAKSRMRTGTAP